MKANLIELGNFSIKWYSFLILIAVIIAYFIIQNGAKKKKINKDFVSDLFFYLVIFSLIGARLYYCLFNLDYYSRNLLSIFKVWEGGLAIHGGIIAGLITIIFFCRSKKISIIEMTDIIVPALALGQAIGRWGNFFNQEAYGAITTLQKLKNMHIPKFIRDGMYIDYKYYHPTFFYESLGCILIFIVLVVISKKLNIRGIKTSIYLIGYGILRFFIESSRQDSLMLYNFKVAQIVSIIMVISGIYLIVRGKVDDK